MEEQFGKLGCWDDEGELEKQSRQETKLPLDIKTEMG